MGLIRLLILLAIGYFVWLNVKTYLRKQQLRQERAEERRRQGPTPVVKCRHCQLHLPQDEAVADGDQWFCSDEHRKAWRQSQRG